MVEGNMLYLPPSIDDNSTTFYGDMHDFYTRCYKPSYIPGYNSDTGAFYGEVEHFHALGNGYPDGHGEGKGLESEIIYG